MKFQLLKLIFDRDVYLEIESTKLEIEKMNMNILFHKTLETISIELKII